MEEKEELQGYLHDVSTLKESEKVRFFYMCIQTESELLRGVCFSPVKHFLIWKKGKPISFDNLVVRREYNTKDIILAKPKTGCKAVKTASFKDNVIQPFELLKSLTTTTTPAEILGVH